MMEYFLGSAITLLICLIVYNQIKSDLKQSKPNRFLNTQSQIYSLVSPIHHGVSLLPPKKLVTQATKEMSKKEVRVVLYGNHAYWITNNTFFTADIVNGIIDKDSTKIVDTMGIDKVELDKLSVIVEKLTEESIDENRNSGNEELF